MHISRSGYDHYYLDINARCGTPVQDLVCGTAAQCGVQMQRRARVTIQLISRTMPMANWAVQSVSIATATAAMLWGTLVSATLLFAVLELVGVEAGPRPRAQVVFSNSITSHSFPECGFEGGPKIVASSCTLECDYDFWLWTTLDKAFSYFFGHHYSMIYGDCTSLSWIVWVTKIDIIYLDFV